MFTGHLAAIYLRPSPGAPTRAVEAAEAVLGQGLEDDYARAKSLARGEPTKPANQVTLIEEEALEGARRDYQLELPANQSRRNLLTRGVPLNHLVGRTFRVGEAVLRGIELCEPCGHLEKLTGAKVVQGLRHRGGLRAEIVTGGRLQVGDAITPVDG